jgi:hypothetical protein
MDRSQLPTLSETGDWWNRVCDDKLEDIFDTIDNEDDNYVTP